MVKGCRESIGSPGVNEDKALDGKGGQRWTPSIVAWRRPAPRQRRGRSATVLCYLRSRWIGYSGYAIAAVLLVAIGITPWVRLLFPLWILTRSLDTLVESLRGRRAGGDPVENAARGQ